MHSGAPNQYGSDQTFTTYPSPRPVPRVRVRVSPGHSRHKPFLFTIAGSVAGPSSIPASADCFGDATVRFLLGKKQVAFDLVALQPNCTFGGQVQFNRLPGRGKRHRQVRLRVLIHWRGNGYLAPADARPQSVLLG